MYKEIYTNKNYVLSCPNKNKIALFRPKVKIALDAGHIF